MKQSKFRLVRIVVCPEIVRGMPGLGDAQTRRTRAGCLSFTPTQTLKTRVVG